MVWALQHNKVLIYFLISLNCLHLCILYKSLAQVDLKVKQLVASKEWKGTCFSKQLQLSN